MADEKADGSHDLREWLAIILLGLAAIATAWATFQAAHWRGEQALAGNRATTTRVQATREADVANRQIVIDVTTLRSGSTRTGAATPSWRTSTSAASGRSSARPSPPGSRRSR